MRDCGDRPGLLVYCQHSVGLGHLVRSAALAAALAERFQVVLATGGPVPAGFAVPAGVELVALPAIGSSDERASALESLEPGLGLEAAFAARRSILLGILERAQPAIVVVEQFPFGRRKFAAELVPLLEAARQRRPRPAVLCSVRDLLVRRPEGQERRDEQTAALLASYFDAVVVHADPRVVRLEHTFPPAARLKIAVHHLGYVVAEDRPLTWRRPARPVVVVSAGGGRSGSPLLTSAAEAHRRHLADLGVTTRLVTGPFLPDATAASLLSQAEGLPSLQVERFVPDLSGAMASASVSVSQCGYNSALDVLRSGVPALVVPFGGDNEQPERARRLARIGAVRVLAQDELDPDVLASEVQLLLDRRPAVPVVDLDGARATARLAAALAGRGPLPAR